MFLAILALPCLADAAASIVVVNQNNPNEGFNDPTSASPVGGNAGITIGQQRLVAFYYAAAIWGAALDGPVSVSIQSLFTGLSCSATSGILGAARPSIAYASPSLPRPNVWYPGALASQLAGRDINPGNPAIDAQFNSAIGNANCLTDFSWYYGLDGMTGPAQFDLIDVVLHEFGHGLGFLTMTNTDTGAELAPQGQTQALQDVWEFMMFDLNLTLHWNQMTNTQRAASARSPRKLVWDGPNVVAAVPRILTGGTPSLRVISPSTVTGDYLVGDAQFGPPLTSAGVSGALSAPLDAAGSRTGCTPPLPSSISGTIALIDRSSGPGGCTFVAKVKNAQAAGAIAVVIADDQPGSPPGPMAGRDPSISIPSLRISQSDGLKLRNAVAAGSVIARELLLPVPRGAADGDRVLLYTPDQYRQGSSVVHTDPIAALLMDPAYNALLGHKLDLTPYFMKDIGWSVSNPDPSEPIADIVLSVARPSGYKPGSNLSYAVSVTNNGPSNASNVLVFSTTPMEITFASSSPDCASGLPCSLGPIAAGSTRRFTVAYAVPSSYSGTIQLVMNAAPAAQDPVTTNNAVTLNTPKSSGCSSAGGEPMLSAALVLLALLRGRKSRG
jgi:uncharacterized repeat protein (TIGR01451 family)